MKMQYGDASLSLQQVYERDGKFKNGVPSAGDADHPGWPHTAHMPEIMEHIK
jgi:hypothetical protein